MQAATNSAKLWMPAPVRSSTASNGYVGLDLGLAKTLSSTMFYPRSDQVARSNGGKFQGSNTSSNSGYTDLYTIGTAVEGWSTYSISGSYRYVRFIAPNGNCNVTELEFYGN